MTRAIIVLFFWLASAFAAYAQQPVTVVGTAPVPGNCVEWFSTTQIKDPGITCNGGSGSGPGGSNGQVQYNNAGAFGGAAGILPTPGGPLTINPTTDTANRGLLIIQSNTATGLTTNPFGYNGSVVTSTVANSATGFTSGTPNNFISGWRANYNTGGTNVGSTFQSAGYFDANVTTGNTNTSSVIGMFGSAYSNVSNSNTGAGLIGTEGYTIVDNVGSWGVAMGMEAEVGIHTGGAAAYRYALATTNIGELQGTTDDAAIAVISFTGFNGSSSGGSFKSMISLTDFGGIAPLATTASMFTTNTAITSTPFTIANVFNMPTTTVTGNILSFPNVTLTGSGGLALNDKTTFTTANTLTSNADSFFHVGGTLTANGNNESVIRLDSTITGTAGGTGNVMVAANYVPIFVPTANIATAVGAQYLVQGNPGTGVTIATLDALAAILSTGTGLGAVTTGNALAVLPVYSTIKPTNANGINISNMGSASITTSTAINIAAQSGSSTNHGIVNNADTLLPNLANVATTSAVCFNTGTGLLTYDGTIGTCNTSDERLKNIGPRIDGALDKLLKINGFYYTYKDQTKYGKGEQIGVGAQTVEKVFPELVGTDSNGIKSVSYDKLVAPIIEALRELKSDNDNLRAEIEKLKKRAGR